LGGGTDSDISSILSILRSGSRPRGEEMPKDVKSLLRDFSRLSIKDGILNRTATLDGEKSTTSYSLLS
jgi:hypothetical protein